MLLLAQNLSIDFKSAQALRLINRGLIKVAGADAEKFLQGLVTCDIKLASQPSKVGCPGAHCNPKGRIIFTFQLFYSQGDYFLSMPESQIECAISALKKYAIFSKVTIEDISQEVSSAQLVTRYPEISEIDFSYWKLREIQAGIAEIYPETREQFTPHELNYHQHGGVSFDKGCYIGQEIVARMHYLGKLKTTLVTASFTADTPPKRGEKIFYSEDQREQSGGYLIDFAADSTHHYTALVSLYTRAQNQDLRVGGGGAKLFTGSG